MRTTMLRSNPLSMFEELLQPYKYGPRVYDNDVGTKEKPTIVTRGEWVERKFKAWREEDGSYHEELIDADDMAELPTKPEMTA
jgi:hypothetical protein